LRRDGGGKRTLLSELRPKGGSMRPILALSIVVVFAGCASIKSMGSNPVLVKAAARGAAYVAAKEAKLSKEKAQEVISHLKILENALPVVLPPNYVEARNKVKNANLGDIETHLLLVLVDFAEANGSEYLKGKEIPVVTASREVTPEEGKKMAKIEEFRKIMEAVIAGAKEGLELVK
jgi:hypothetical protein